MTVAEYNNIVQLHSDALYRFIIKTLRYQADAEDVIQNAFEKLWMFRDNVAIETAKSYLFTIAYHKMIDFLRIKKRTTLVDNFIETDLAHLQDDTNFETKRLLDNAFNNLDSTQKMLVMLKDYEGYNYEEIGNITKLNASQVKVYLHRARLAMKNYLVSIETVI